MANDRAKLELSVPQIIGGALAAASAAVASSWLGVAGTVLGAIIVSLVASIGGAVYSHSLERSSKALRETLPVVPVRPLRATTRSPTGSAGSTATAVLPAVGEDSVDHAGPSREDAEDQTGSADRAGRRRTDGREIRWRTVAVSAAVSLVLAIVALTGFETLIGRSASSLTGGDDSGTTLSQLVSHGSSSTTRQQPSTTPGGPSSTSDDQPTTTEPTPTGSTAPTPTGSTGPTPAGSPGPTTTGPTGGTPTGTVPTGSTPTG
jgi:hypothetical protein